jgi:hypothetical protein
MNGGCAREIASGLFTPFHADTLDGERILQAPNSRFLCFAPISYMVPQKSSNIHAIYHNTQVRKSLLSPFLSGKGLDSLLLSGCFVLSAHFSSCPSLPHHQHHILAVALSSNELKRGNGSAKVRLLAKI